MKFHKDVLAAHAQFGGDLEDMQRRYDAQTPTNTPAPASEAADVAEIPQEILDEADEICSQIAEFGKPAQETIARALMARDQRAAEIARHLNGWGSNPAPELAEHIATAILTYGAKP